MGCPPISESHSQTFTPGATVPCGYQTQLLPLEKRGTLPGAFRGKPEASRNRVPLPGRRPHCAPAGAGHSAPGLSSLRNPRRTNVRV